MADEATLIKQIENLSKANQDLKGKLRAQDELLKKHFAHPYGYATVLSVCNSPDPNLFKIGKKVNKIGSHLRGKILSNVVEGKVECEFQGLKDNYAIGIDCPPEILLLEGDDGTYVVILHGEKPYKISGRPDLNLSIGDTVVITLDQNSPPTIIEKTDPVMLGPVVEVSEVFQDGSVSVQITGGVTKAVKAKEGVARGNRVILDQYGMSVIQVVPTENRSNYKVTNNLNISWDDIGGLSYAKEELQKIIEWPITRKDVFEHYGTPIPKGGLLYGPPGCGKTLLAKACFTSLAELHGAELKDTGFIYCKGPEILNKYVGNTESEIRMLFKRGEDHYNKWGYPAIMFIDESDAILRKRGTDPHVGMLNTIVPQFLSEMDGLVTTHTIVLLATNRPNSLDPAVTRDGRIDRRIKIKRPNEKAAYEILEIYLQNVPLHETSKDEICAFLMADIFSKGRALYQINSEHMFCLGNALSGGMLKGFVEEAKMYAIGRDTKDNLTGVTLKDFRNAVEKVYRSHLDVSHDYDIEDFVEEKGLCGDIKVDKMNSRKINI